MIKKYCAQIVFLICYAANGQLRASQLQTVDDITPLMRAVSEDRRGMFDVLVNSGIALDRQDSQGRTALMYAIIYHRPVLAHLLLEAGADINKQDNNGVSPLMWASANGYYAGVKVLLKKKPQLNRQDDFGFTALMLAAGRNNNRKIILALLQAGANPFVSSFDVQTISTHLEKKQRSDSEIKRSISRHADTTFESILQQKKSKLVHDPVIQKLVAEYKEYEKKRREYSRKIVAPLITESIQEHFPLDLAKIVADYATEKNPEIVELSQLNSDILETNAVLEQAASCCVIT